MNLKAISISYKKASISLREKISLSEDESANVLIKLKEILGFQEALVLSTCNRTEVYYISNEDLSDEVIKVLASQKGYLLKDQELDAFVRITDDEKTILHLYKVSLGLDSQILGDLQILNQVKKAYQLSVTLDMAGPFLHRLLHSIFSAHKRVVQETPFFNGPSTVSYACKCLVDELAVHIDNPEILLIGTGEMGEDLVKSLQKGGFSNITLINRTKRKATQLAEKWGFKAADFENLSEEIKKADVIVSAISGNNREFLISLEEFPKLNVNARKSFIDLSVPRSIDPSIASLPQAFLFNVDDLKEKISTTLTIRKNAIPAVEQIIEASIHSFNSWISETSYLGAIKKLKHVLEDIKKKEIGRYLKKLNSQELEMIDLISTGILNKVIQIPVLQMKSACKRGDTSFNTNSLIELFGLENEEHYSEVK